MNVRYDPRPRHSGPGLVTDGRTGAPAILVLDPLGAAKHFDVPASWHPLLGQRQVAWCRIPARDSLILAQQRMDALAAKHITVDILTSGPLAELAMQLARQWAAAVRSVLLVDPAEPEPRPDGSSGSGRWADRVRDHIDWLADAGIVVRTITVGLRSPLLGHPAVVDAVRETLDDLDRTGQT